MRRFLAVLLGIVFVALAASAVGSGPGGLSGALDAMRFTVVPRQQCDLLLTDGSTATVPADRAEALVAAAVGGTAAPGDGTGPAPEQLALSAPMGVTCSIPRSAGGDAGPLNAVGLTPRAQALHDGVLSTFGKVPYGGFAPGGVSTGHGARSAHYEGKAVDYFFRPVGDEQQRARGWVLANWLVAHATRYEIAVIIFDDRIWSARRSAQGWRPYTNPDSGADPISRHLDHVHVDVV